MSAIFPADIISAVSREECGALSTLAADKDVLEVGSDYGRSTIALASTARLVVAIDWHQGDGHAGYRDTAAEFMHNLTRYGVRNRVVAMIGDVTLAAPKLGEHVFGMAFVDAFHEYEAVRRDIDLILPRIEPGGIIAFHDYSVPAFGVERAVNELAESYSTDVVHAVHSLVYVHV